MLDYRLKCPVCRCQASSEAAIGGMTMQRCQAHV